MLMNIPDNRKEPRGLCKPPRFHRVVAGLFLGSRRGARMLAFSPGSPVSTTALKFSYSSTSRVVNDIFT